MITVKRIEDIKLIELKCDFCKNILTEIDNGHESAYLKKSIRQFRCLSCPKLVTYFYDNNLLKLKARTIWTQIKDKDIVVFKSYIKNICHIEVFHQQNQVLNKITDIPFEANITPANVDTKVPIFITFS